MSSYAPMLLLTGMGVVGLLVAISGWVQPMPSLTRTVGHLRRTGAAGDSRAVGPSRQARLLGQVVAVLSDRPRLFPTNAELRLADRTHEQHALALVASCLAGFVVPALAMGFLQGAGLASLSLFVPVVAALLGAVIGPLVVHTTLVQRAGEARTNMRYQLSAYLDVVTMLLAGNAGYEAALEQAAHAGDGRLFVELRRRMRESGARGSSLTDALRSTGADLGLDELEQIAATAALSAAEGAPVARTLSAKCATLRTALATEQEAEARLRTSRLTTPIVGMALIFMALVMYPALNFS